MSDGFIQRGGGWVVAQFVLLFAIALLGAFHHRESGVSIWLGLALLAVAGLCGLAGTVALGRNLTPFPKPGSQTRLVQGGIYSLIRHPLYTAVICAALGWSLCRGSGPAFVASLGLAVFFDAKARREERWLRERFPDYRLYERKVKRFIPKLY